MGGRKREGVLIIDAFFLMSLPVHLALIVGLL